MSPRMASPDFDDCPGLSPSSSRSSLCDSPSEFEGDTAPLAVSVDSGSLSAALAQLSNAGASFYAANKSKYSFPQAQASGLYASDSGLEAEYGSAAFCSNYGYGYNSDSFYDIGHTYTLPFCVDTDRTYYQPASFQPPAFEPRDLRPVAPESSEDSAVSDEEGMTDEEVETAKALAEKQRATRRHTRTKSVSGVPVEFLAGLPSQEESTCATEEYKGEAYDGRFVHWRRSILNPEAQAQKEDRRMRHSQPVCKRSAYATYRAQWVAENYEMPLRPLLGISKYEAKVQNAQAMAEHKARLVQGFQFDRKNARAAVAELLSEYY